MIIDDDDVLVQKNRNDSFEGDVGNFSDTQIIYTNSGPVRGKQLITIVDNKLYHSFKGIPYAKPPIKELRFKVRQFLMNRYRYIKCLGVKTFSFY